MKQHIIVARFFNIVLYAACIAVAYAYGGVGAAVAAGLARVSLTVTSR